MGLSTLKLVQPTAPQEVPDDEIKRISRNDRERAFEFLVRKYRDRIYYHALYITHDSQEAFDVAQDVFVRAYHEPRLYDEAFQLRAWLFRVCTNRCYNLVRDKNRRSGILERIGEQEDLLRDDHKVVDSLLQRELSSGVSRAMERLSPEHRTILMLRYHQDLSYQEIADVLDIKMGTVMSRLSRAKVRLHELLSEDGTV
jgi:RNA polymerase sigma-70 factor (ECF subfamily)